MRVNEENFAVGDKENIKPSYVDVAVTNHNNNEAAHPDIRKVIADAQAFYQGAKDSVAGVAETAVNAQSNADKAAENAEKSEEAAEEAMKGAVDAKGEAETAAASASESAKAAATSEENARRYCQDAEVAMFMSPYIDEETGNWFVTDPDDINSFVDTGVKAQGEDGEDGYTPQRGVDYWTPEDIAEIKSQVDESIQSAILDSWEAAV